MSGLKAGFARVDVTPNLGYSIEGYYEKRYADGVLDNLYATAVAFSDGKKKAIIISLDAIGMSKKLCDPIRKLVAEKIGTDIDGVFIACTHTHLGLGFSAVGKGNELVDKAYDNVTLKICDAAVLATNDLKPAKLSYTRGEVEDVAFIRRYKMKDGSACTFPDEYAAYVVDTFAKPDKTVQHLIIKREGGHSIGIVNFQVHADTIGGSTISADFPHFVRDTYEKLVPDSRCMFINGPEGDCNGTNIKVPMDHPMRKSYKKAEYMGRKIAMAAVAEYEFAIPLKSDKISFGHKNVMVKHNKGTAEEVEFALKVRDVYIEKGGKVTTEFVSKETGLPITGEYGWITPAKKEMQRLLRISNLIKEPDEKELCLTAVAIGDVVFAGFPGEPFTDVGRQVKAKSKFAFTITGCCSNGYEGYFPTKDAFMEDGYEAVTAKYACGAAEKLIETSLELIEAL